MLPDVNERFDFVSSKLFKIMERGIALGLHQTLAANLAVNVILIALGETITPMNVNEEDVCPGCGGIEPPHAKGN